jgi:hypothetical protein
MPIIINELDSQFPDEPLSEAALIGRVAELQRHVETLEASVRDLAQYCQNLEVACREAFAQMPGRTPFPPVPRL